MEPSGSSSFWRRCSAASSSGAACVPTAASTTPTSASGDSLVMLSEASEAYPARPCVHFVYVDDVDASYRAALAAGARPILEPTEQPWGDRTCGFHDPLDNRWWVATHLRDFS
jgi:uncharacterized glyoxalase superfamily protein PhnB